MNHPVSPTLPAQNASETFSLRSLLGDGRNFQIVFLCCFLIFGIFNLGWDVDIPRFTVSIGACLLFQWLALAYWGGTKDGLKSGMISGLSLCMMLKAYAWWVPVFAAAISIFSKYLIRFRGKHVFNPTNLGIVATVILTGEAWISPGQWGSNVALVAFIGLLGLMVVLKVGRLDTALVFIGTLAIFEFSRNVLYLGWPADFFFHQFTSGTLLLFAFFMITDPVTTPNRTISRVIWAALVACLSFYLTYWHFVFGAPIYALCIMSVFTPVFDMIFKGKKFNWKTS
jgi:Na+-transporting NADH:ubiquinone oxidoreductase subunit NqrB